MSFKLQDFHRDTSSEELLADLKIAAKSLSQQNRKLTFRSYAEVGRFSAGTFAERFGSWNNALIAAGILPNQEKNVTVEALFENLSKVWISKGRQPVFRDMSAPPSQFGAQVYAARFGSWRSALQEFVAHVKSSDWITNGEEQDNERGGDQIHRNGGVRKTSSNITPRMRLRILARDGFSCQSCGASPARDRGVELHVDHILPWTRGGETEEANLQTKCKQCNLGKGNAFDQ